MSEFGYQYSDPEIGIFYSRLRPKSLQKTDRIRGEPYAQILNKSVNKDYKQFLKEYNPISNPFLHELRVHVFRRDYYYKKATKTSDINEKKKFYFIAFKENLILKKYFTTSMKNSVYCWNDDKEFKSEELIDKSKPYKSVVSSNLITSFSEKTMWSAILIIFILLGLTNFTLKFMSID